MSLVRPITADDVPRVTELVGKFVSEMDNHPAGFCPDSVSGFLSSRIGSPGFIGLGIETLGTLSGVIFGLVGDDWLGGKLIAQEMVWYVVPGECRGLELMRAFLNEAEERGVKLVVSGHVAGFHNRRMTILFKRLGFTETERWYVKGLD